jgi:hypothetical protein
VILADPEDVKKLVFGPVDTPELEALRRDLRRLTNWMNDPKRLNLLAAAGPARFAGNRDYREMMEPVERGHTDGGDIASMLGEARYEDGAPMSEQDLGRRGRQGLSARASGTRHDRRSQPGQFERGLPQAAIIYAKEAEDLAKVVPPTTLKKSWEAYINAVHVYGEYTNSLYQEFKAGHKSVSPAIQQNLGALQRTEIGVGKRYGFKWCVIGE